MYGFMQVGYSSLLARLEMNLLAFNLRSEKLERRHLALWISIIICMTYLIETGRVKHTMSQYFNSSVGCLLSF